MAANIVDCQDPKSGAAQGTVEFRNRRVAVDHDPVGSSLSGCLQHVTRLLLLWERGVKTHEFVTRVFNSLKGRPL